MYPERRVTFAFHFAKSQWNYVIMYIVTLGFCYCYVNRGFINLRTYSLLL